MKGDKHLQINVTRSVPYLLALITAILLFGAMVTGETYSCINVPYYPTKENRKEDYYDWEWAIIQNGGWYTDATTGGTRFSDGLSCAYSRMTTGELVPVYACLSGWCDGVVLKFRNGTLTEDEIMYLINDGKLNEYYKGYPTDLAYRSRLVKIWLTNGYMTEYVEQLKAANCLEKEYVLPKEIPNNNVVASKSKENGLFTALEFYEFTK